jgi:limonene-1,2-epoxide hydrolase
MTDTPLDVAQAYHDAWTCHDLDKAMSYVADDIVCDAPGRRIEGAEQYRAFLGGFMAKLTGVENIARFGDDRTAVLFYYPHTALVGNAPTAECFTVINDKITRTVLVFDRPSFSPPQA